MDRALMQRRWHAGLLRNVTTRLVILLMLTLMIITGVYDYILLVRERERLEEQIQEDQRIFAETLALVVSRNVRWGTAELKELLDDILARPGLVAPQGATIRVTTGPNPLLPEEGRADIGGNWSGRPWPSTSWMRAGG